MDRNNDEVVEYHEFIHWICGAQVADKVMLSKVIELQEEKKEAIKRKAREDVIAKRKALEQERAEESRKYREEEEAKKEEYSEIYSRG